VWLLVWNPAPFFSLSPPFRSLILILDQSLTYRSEFSLLFLLWDFWLCDRSGPVESRLHSRPLTCLNPQDMAFQVFPLEMWADLSVQLCDMKDLRVVGSCYISRHLMCLSNKAGLRTRLRRQLSLDASKCCSTVHAICSQPLLT